MKSSITFILLLISVSGFAQLTYKDVAPIFFSRCTSCHHDGGAGPFPLMSYSQTLPNSGNIFTALTNGLMPPWSPDTTYTRFLHERIITDNEKSDILTWINNGSPAGDTTLAPPPPVYGMSQLYGTPNLELQMPAFVSNAVSTDSYICVSFPTNLTQDRYLRAFEIIPGNASIVHHALLSVDTLGTVISDFSGTCFNLPGDFGLGGFAPGAPPTVFPGQAPLKLGILIKAGSNIVMQLHYPAGSAGIVDSTRIRIYFYPLNETGIRPVLVSTPLQNWSLVIPPDTVMEYTATFPQLPLAVSFLATFPHSHLLCTSIVNSAVSGPDTIPLIRINEWDFEWQGYYTYRYPVKIPAGYDLFSSHIFDNTIANPHNPNNPPQMVLAGLSTTDEMLFDSFQWTYYLPGDEFIDVEALLDGDTLLSGLPSNPTDQQGDWSAWAFPNPAVGSCTIRINSNAPAKFSINIYDIKGQFICQLPAPAEIYGSYFTSWNGKLHNGKIAPAGIYFYRVESENRTTNGKLVWMPAD